MLWLSVPPCLPAALGIPREPRGRPVVEEHQVGSGGAGASGHPLLLCRHSVGRPKAEIVELAPLDVTCSGEYSNLRWDVPPEHLQYYWKQASVCPKAIGRAVAGLACSSCLEGRPGAHT